MADSLTNGLLTEVLTMLGRVARDPACHAECGPLADRLGSAMAARAHAQSAGGQSKGGGRPALPVRVEARGEWEATYAGAKEAAQAINKEYGYEVVKDTSLGVALGRGAGRWDTVVQHKGREIFVSAVRVKAGTKPA